MGRKQDVIVKEPMERLMARVFWTNKYKWLNDYLYLSVTSTSIYAELSIFQ